MTTKTRTQRRILKVTIHHELDTDPDLSCIGEYSSKPTSPDAIDREERGDMLHNEFRYFNPTNTAAETGNPESPEQDYKRMEDYNRQEWCMVGIHASAEVQLVPQGPIQRITSGGLWGIESDSGDDFFSETEEEQLSELRRQLVALGFSEKKIDSAFAEPEHKEFC